jgi:ligand-binding SRPBCC domain-containing protein
VKHVLEREQLIPYPRSKVFAFFSEAGNLERLTPPSLHFEILTPLPIAMHEGSLIEYRIALFFIPFGWQTIIESYEPEIRFVDRQLRGPYSFWHHTHEFEEVKGGTLMRDRVLYEVPLGPIGEVARALFVDRQLKAIFDFRQRAVAAIFPGVEPVAP